jgi:homoserine acetyltransferase
VPDGRPWGSRFPRITIRDQVAAEVQDELAKLIRGADGPHYVRSPYGHDAFLIETDQVGTLVSRTLKYVSVS